MQNREEVRSVKTIGSDHKAGNGDAIEKRPNPPEPIEEFIRQDALQQFQSETQPVRMREFPTEKPRGAKVNPIGKGTSKHKVGGSSRPLSAPKKRKKPTPKKHQPPKWRIKK